MNLRNEQEMMHLIVNTAMNDERIRAVLMNGSRVNPNAKKDFLQDYDIVYLVKNIESFTSNHSWVDNFGVKSSPIPNLCMNKSIVMYSFR